MAKLAVAGARRGGGGGSNLKLALVVLIVLGAVLGILNMAPDSLHMDLRKELRQETGEPRAACMCAPLGTAAPARRPPPSHPPSCPR